MSKHLPQFDPGKRDREASQLRTAIVDSVTHEVRTPLTSIKASVTALLTDSRLQPSQRNDLLLVINEEADRLNQLFGEAMMSAQRDASGKLDLPPHAIEEITAATATASMPLLATRWISVQLQQGLPAV